MIRPQSQSLWDAELRCKPRQFGCRIHTANHCFPAPKFCRVRPLFFTPHIHSILDNSLTFERYLPCENRFAIRNEHPPAVCLFRQRRYDLPQSQQGPVNAHAFLHTRNNQVVVLAGRSKPMYATKILLPSMITAPILASIHYLLPYDAKFANFL